MPVSGKYLAFQLRGTLPLFRIYRDSILADALAGFINLEQRADAVAETAFNRFASHPATDDSGDMSQEAEWAGEQGHAYYEAMVNLRQATINLLATGLFHLLEQQLAKLTFDRTFQDMHLAPDDVGLKTLKDWYKEHFALDFENLPEWKRIGELRLIAGAVKHADGRSARDLLKKRPELFRNPILDSLPTPANSNRPLRSPLAGEDLFVTEQIFAQYANAAYDFVAAIVAHFQQSASKSYPCG